MMDELTIERMQLEDMAEVMALDRQCFRTPWSEIAFRSEIQSAAAYYLVARLDGRLVGYGGAWLVVDEAHVTTIGVDPALRGRKIGERIFAAIMTEAFDRGVRRASLEVRESNVAAIRLYEKYGFTPVARRRRYYADNNEDAIVMWIEDLASPAYRQRLRANTRALAEAIHACPGD
jgi:ribosomal-protein-alanine N-acetyltransferase